MAQIIEKLNKMIDLDSHKSRVGNLKKVMASGETTEQDPRTPTPTTHAHNTSEPPANSVHPAHLHTSMFSLATPRRHPLATHTLSLLQTTTHTPSRHMPPTHTHACSHTTVPVSHTHVLRPNHPTHHTPLYAHACTHYAITRKVHTTITRRYTWWPHI